MVLVKNVSADTLGLSGKCSIACVPVFLYTHTMTAAPADLLLISADLKGRQICPLVLGLILFIMYCATPSKAVFDSSKTRAVTVNQEYRLASQELRIYLVEVACRGKGRWREGRGQPHWARVKNQLDKNSHWLGNNFKFFWAFLLSLAWDFSLFEAAPEDMSESASLG